MRYKQWVIDATIDTGPDGPLTFCPLDGGDVMTGLTMIGLPPVGAEIVGIAHMDGQAAADAWYQDNQARVKQAVASHQARADA